MKLLQFSNKILDNLKNQNMKTQLLKLIFFIFVINQSNAQNRGVNFRYEVLDPNHAGKLFKNPDQEMEKPKGSPYIVSKFLDAKVATVSQIAKMRYNTFSDEFEFITATNDTLVLDKIQDFDNILFSHNNQNYRLLDYKNENKTSTRGYLITLFESEKLALFKKEIILLSEAKIAKTSLEMNMPAKYQIQDPSYFLKIQNNEIVLFPKNKKELFKLYIDKKDKVETFLKEQKIDLKNEKDLIETVTFLATL